MLSTLRLHASLCPQTDLVHNTTDAMDSTASTDSLSTRRSYATALSSNSESPSNSKVFHNSDVQTRSAKLVPNPEKKFNIVIYGINECPKGTTRSERLKSDLSKVVSVVSGINLIATSTPRQ